MNILQKMPRVYYYIVSVVAFLIITVAFWPSPHKAVAALDVVPTRKAEIIIQSNKVGADLTDFPVLLTKDNVPVEACDADGTSPAQNGGGDIRFTSDENGNNQLPLEVVHFSTANDPTNCTVEMYVKVPTISSSTDTSIWMWYNTSATDTQPSASSTYGSESVWDSNYKGVWHLGESSGTRYDSTSNSHDLTAVSVGSAAGKWGSATDFEDDDGSYLDGGDVLDMSGDLTFEVWLKPESVVSGTRSILAKYYYTGDQRSYLVQYKDVSGTKKLYWANSNDGTYNNDIFVDSDLGVDSWKHVVGVYDASEGAYSFYIDGSLVGSTQTGLDTSIYNSSAAFRLGDRSEGYESEWDGLMQAARISNTIRSADWISAEYNNQNDPATFAVVQAPQSGSMAPESITVIKSTNESVTNTATLQDDDDFTFALKANTQYVISGGIFSTSTTNQPDIKIGFSVPTGATMDIGYLAQGGNIRTAALLETPDVSSAQIDVPANSNAVIQPFGSIVTGATSGNLTFKWSQFTSSATATTVKQGSFMTVTEVTN